MPTVSVSPLLLLIAPSMVVRTVHGFWTPLRTWSGMEGYSSKFQLSGEVLSEDMVLAGAGGGGLPFACAWQGAVCAGRWVAAISERASGWAADDGAASGGLVEHGGEPWRVVCARCGRAQRTMGSKFGPRWPRSFGEGGGLATDECFLPWLSSSGLRAWMWSPAVRRGGAASAAASARAFFDFPQPHGEAERRCCHVAESGQTRPEGGRIPVTRNELGR